MKGHAERFEPLKLYQILKKHFGPSNWWPGESPFEIIVGAVLTQNTSWANVEKAIINLKAADKLDIDSIMQMGLSEFAELIRPSGYYNLKAGRIKNLIDAIYSDSGSDLNLFLSKEPELLRNKLLEVKGIGKETADSICCYAAEKCVFVVDAYTKRILSRHGVINELWDYDMVQDLFEKGFADNIEIYKDLHAYMVFIGKEFCKKKTPVCGQCPLKDWEQTP